MSEIKREQLIMALVAGRGPAYLRGLNLSSMDLSNAGWLVEADLRHADLSNANLRRSNLFRANLERADLHSANLIGANLDEASLLKVKANVANFNVTRLRGANMRGISLVGASLVRADLEEADLDGADLEGANFEGSNLRKARLTNANLKLINLDGADLTETILDTAGMGGNYEPAALPGFHGTVTSIKLSDLIQLGCLSRSDLEIEVSSGGEKGHIYIGMGRVLHALSGGLEGEEALLRIFSWDSGRFTTRAGVPGGTVSIEKPVEHLLLQSVRLKDERKYEGRYSGFVRKIRDYIPVEARASEPLIEFLGESGKLNASEKIEITDVFDSDDGEEIMCSLSVRDEVFIAPLKFVNLDRGHPLFSELAQLVSK